MGFGTDCIHAGQASEPTTGSVNVPVFQTSTYEQQGIGQHKGYEYARTQNPTREALERCLAALEGATHGVCFGSGMAALSVLVQLFDAGDEIVCSHNVYGGTFRAYDKVFTRQGLIFHWVDMSDLSALKKALNKKTRMVLLETPTNPMLQIADIRAVADLTHEAGAILVCDNTFLSPALQRPLEFGADAVVHSTTKYINGHSDVVGGVVVTSDESLHERLRFLQNSCGAVPGPWDCFLTLRGVKTLKVRMRAHEENAQACLEALQDHKAIQKLYYPGLKNHPGHDIAVRQQDGFGAMISFDVGTLERAQKVVQGVRIFTLAESLGGVESLISHPAVMTHAGVPKKDRDAMGMGDGLVRISCGIEDAEDLVADLLQALDSALTA